MSYFKVAINTSKDFKYNFKGADRIGNLQSYRELSVITSYGQAFIIVRTHSLIRMEREIGP
jgi:hypothetical protein